MRPVADVAGEDHHDAGVGDQRADRAPGGHAIAGHDEMRGDRGPEREGGDQHGGVAGGGGVAAEVHQRGLRHEEHSEPGQRYEFGAPRPQRHAGRERVDQHDEAAQGHPQRAEPQRSDMLEAGLDRDRVAAPEHREEQREQSRSAAERSAFVHTRKFSR